MLSNKLSSKQRRASGIWSPSRGCIKHFLWALGDLRWGSDCMTHLLGQLGDLRWALDQAGLLVCLNFVQQVFVYAALHR